MSRPQLSVKHGPGHVETGRAQPSSGKKEGERDSHFSPRISTSESRIGRRGVTHLAYLYSYRQASREEEHLKGRRGEPRGPRMRKFGELVVK